MLPPFSTPISRPSSIFKIRVANSEIRSSCVTITMQRFSLRTFSLTKANDGLPGIAVERSGRLVHDHDVRLPHNGAGDGDALLFASAQLDRRKIGAAFQADDVQVLGGLDNGVAPVLRFRINGIATFSAVVSRGNRWKS